MKIFFKSIIALITLLSTLNASPARSGAHTFTQPDGTQFEGVLRGDSSFHWIESDSKVVMYNKEDKFYYNAALNANKKLQMTKEKPVSKRKNGSSQVSAISTVSKEKTHTVDEATKQALRTLQKESRKGHRPR